jgi:hypothetical protein
MGDVHLAECQISIKQNLKIGICGSFYQSEYDMCHTLNYKHKLTD